MNIDAAETTAGPAEMVHVDGLEHRITIARPRRDHRDDGCLFWLVALTAPFVLLASLFRRCRR